MSSSASWPHLLHVLLSSRFSSALAPPHLSSSMAEASVLIQANWGWIVVCNVSQQTQTLTLCPSAPLPPLQMSHLWNLDGVDTHDSCSVIHNCPALVTLALGQPINKAPPTEPSAPRDDRSFFGLCALHKGPLRGALDVGLINLQDHKESDSPEEQSARTPSAEAKHVTHIPAIVPG
uniref:Uncharacterized protein n=1 Tax=Knipowitschia caucasica TaxID=637954 RepID=A0AAV2KTP5_KNICA